MKKPAAVMCARYASPLGGMLLAAREEGLLGCWFEDQAHFPPHAKHWTELADHPLLRTAVTQLEEWFGGRRRGFTLPLAAEGTVFQHAVWQAIGGIAYGQHRRYGELAAQIGQPRAARALGAATGRNPLTIIVPCHRVLGAHDALVGYAGGLARKRALLAHEASVLGAGAETVA